MDRTSDPIFGPIRRLTESEIKDPELAHAERGAAYKHQVLKLYLAPSSVQKIVSIIVFGRSGIESYAYRLEIQSMVKKRRISTRPFY